MNNLGHTVYKRYKSTFAFNNIFYKYFKKNNYKKALNRVVIMELLIYFITRFWILIIIFILIIKILLAPTKASPTFLKIIKFFINSSLKIGLSYKFRNYYYIIMKVKLFKNIIVKLICINISYYLILINKK